MKVLVEYNVGTQTKPINISAERHYDDDNYTRVICLVMNQMQRAGHELLNIRCLNPHPNDKVEAC